MQKLNEVKNLHFPSNKWQPTSNSVIVVCPFLIWLNFTARAKRSGLWTVAEVGFQEGKDEKSVKIPKVQVLDGLCLGSFLMVCKKHLLW